MISGCIRLLKIKLMQQLEPQYEIPHRMTFLRSVVPAIYQEVKLMEMHSKLALTTDMWTSEANDAYLGLSCHYLTATFEMVLFCHKNEYFSGRHTGANIAACLKQILSNYSINQAFVFVVVTDNASNMDLALHLVEWNSRHCFGHTPTTGY